MQIKIPYLAEGVESGTVVNILVREGEQVKKDQTVLELETNKATAPIPAPESGIVTKINIKEGQEVSIGQTIMTLEESGTSGTASKRKRKETVSSPEEVKEISETPVMGGGIESKEYAYESKSGFPPPVSPSIRKMAMEFGIDLTKVRGSERGGRITAKDIKAYIQSLRVAGPQQKTQKVAVPLSANFSKWGPVSKKQISLTRRTIGQRMQESWTTIPHVTQFDEADITSLLELRKKYVVEYEKKGTRLTVTSLILKVVVPLLKKYPIFNSSFDEANGEIIFKEYYHLGVAVDTEQGLIVPVIRDVDQKDLLELSAELGQLSEKARQRKISLEDIQGGTFTISNLGSIGGTYFTPIVNKPEVAILGIGRGVLKPIVRNGKTEVRTMLPLALSYDHRVIDGADGARFIKELVQRLENFKEELLILQPSRQKKSNTVKRNKVRRK